MKAGSVTAWLVWAARHDRGIVIGLVVG